jgi:hypothetical protein
MALLNPPQPTALEPDRYPPPRGDEPARPADGMVTLTAKHLATSHATAWDAILAARGRSTGGIERAVSRGLPAEPAGWSDGSRVRKS